MSPEIDNKKHGYRLRSSYMDSPVMGFVDGSSDSGYAEAHSQTECGGAGSATAPLSMTSKGLTVNGVDIMPRAV